MQIKQRDSRRACRRLGALLRQTPLGGRQETLWDDSEDYLWGDDGDIQADDSDADDSDDLEEFDDLDELGRDDDDDFEDVEIN